MSYRQCLWVVTESPAQEELLHTYRHMVVTHRFALDPRNQNRRCGFQIFGPALFSPKGPTSWTTSSLESRQLPLVVGSERSRKEAMASLEHIR